MAKKRMQPKTLFLRIDAEMMDAIETWAADEFRSTMARSSTSWTRHYEKQAG